LYGSIPLSIAIDSLGGAESFTYQDLVNSGADVVILSDPAGGRQQYSASEISAILRYASEGHNVIGTYLVFQFDKIDNRGLAPVFGLRSDLVYNTKEVSISNQFNKLVPANFLFEGISGSSWFSNGYPYTQVPNGDRQWNPSDLAGAVLVAESDTFKGMISMYDGGTYKGIYISNMPEYFGSTLDKQLLYNAIVAPPLPIANQPQVCVVQVVANGAVVSEFANHPTNPTLAVLVPPATATNVPVSCQDLMSIGLGVANQEVSPVSLQITVFTHQGTALCTRGPFTLSEHGARGVVFGSDCLPE
jgi:hypothetical protein